MSNKNIPDHILNQLKSFNWDHIIDFGFNTVSHLKGGQSNFWRGSMTERLISRQDSTLECVRLNHKDFEWHRFNVTLELKSQFNLSMYNKGGRLKPSYKINLCNLRSKRKIKTSEICDIILVLRKDGAFAISKKAAIHNTIQHGNQVDIIIGPDQIHEITGYKVLNKVNQETDINQLVDEFCDYIIDRSLQDFNKRKE